MPISDRLSRGVRAVDLETGKELPATMLSKRKVRKMVTRAVTSLGDRERASGLRTLERAVGQFKVGRPQQAIETIMTGFGCIVLNRLLHELNRPR